MFTSVKVLKKTHSRTIHDGTPKKYFKTMLQTAKETGIGNKDTKEANAAVSRLTSPQRDLSNRILVKQVFLKKLVWLPPPN